MSLCRICLSINVKMFDLRQTYLEEYYANLVHYNLNDKLTCCYMCYALLKRSYKLMVQARRTNNILLQYDDTSQIPEGLNQNTVLNMTVKVLDNIFIGQNEFVKEENLEEIKEESEDHLDVSEPIELKIEDSVSKSESEDDVPLSELHVETQEEKKKRVKKKRHKFTETKINAREIILTEEQQLTDMQNRARSINYLNSPYKCGLCYRGFIDPVAFGKHRVKHDEKYGQHKCPICQLRYTSARLLRAHALSAHSRRYECDLCHQITHTRHQAKEHAQWHNGRTFLCKLCGKSFVKSSSYLTHLRKSHASSHICVSCGASFVNGYGLRMHMAKSHRGETDDKKDEPISESFCSICKIQFKTVEAWIKHAMSTHYNFEGKGTTCPVCKEHISEAHRYSHSRTHISVSVSECEFEKSPALTALACDHCDLKFFNLTKLRTHIKRVHLGYKYDKNLICENCGKRCTQSLAALRRHQRRHSGERPYPCARCAARFGSRSHALAHARTHSRERPYACASCGKPFAHRPALNRHQAIHTGRKPHVCPICGKGFSQAGSMRTHMRTHHDTDTTLPRAATTTDITI